MVLNYIYFLKLARYEKTLNHPTGIIKVPIPGVYSLVRYLFASGRFVIFMPAVSYSTLFPALRAIAPRFIVSVTGPASRKLPGVWVLF